MTHLRFFHFRVRSNSRLKIRIGNCSGRRTCRRGADADAFAGTPCNVTAPRVSGRLPVAQASRMSSATSRSRGAFDGCSCGSRAQAVKLLDAFKMRRGCSPSSARAGIACRQPLLRCALFPHALPHGRRAQSCETLCSGSSDLSSSNRKVEVTCSIHSHFGFGDVRTRIFELMPLTAQGFTGRATVFARFFKQNR
jgi:hypothetical protein